MEFRTLTKDNAIDIWPPSQGFNFMKCETWGDASMCCVALSKWLAERIREQEHYRKTVGSKQAQDLFVERLKELQNNIDHWLIELEEEVV